MFHGDIIIVYIMGYSDRDRKYSKDRRDDRNGEYSRSRDRHTDLDRRHATESRGDSRKREFDRYQSNSGYDDGSSAAKKAARMAKLAAWKANKVVQGESEGLGEGKGDDAYVDPLDAFMSAEVLPEVKEKEKRERREAEEERKKLEAMVKKGHIPKSLREIIQDPDHEEMKADLEVKIPASKIKRVIGPGGEIIRGIEKRSKCKIQHTKSDMSMHLGFGSSIKEQLEAHSSNTSKDDFVTLKLYGKPEACESARVLIMEAVENKEQKAKQRAREYEKKKEDRRAQRQIYHLRHSKDYEALGVPLGTSKAEVKAAYRKLALIWHPDKNQGPNREEAESKFQEISRAYDNLMRTDEDDEGRYRSIQC